MCRAADILQCLCKTNYVSSFIRFICAVFYMIKKYLFPCFTNQPTQDLMSSNQTYHRRVKHFNVGVSPVQSYRILYI